MPRSSGPSLSPSVSTAAGSLSPEPVSQQCFQPRGPLHVVLEAEVLAEAVRKAVRMIEPDALDGSEESHKKVEVAEVDNSGE